MSLPDDLINEALKAADIFQDFPLGRLLLSTEEVTTQDILQCYIRDFVFMVYPVQTENECNVSKIIQNMAKLREFDGTKPPLTCDSGVTVRHTKLYKLVLLLRSIQSRNTSI